MDIETHRELLNEIAALKRRCLALEAALARVLEAVPSAAPAETVPGNEALKELRASLWGYPDLSQLEAMTRLIEVQRIARAFPDTEAHPAIALLRRLKIDEMHPRDCAAKLAEIDRMTQPAPAVVPVPAAAAAGAIVTDLRFDKQGGVTVTEHHGETCPDCDGGGSYAQGNRVIRCPKCHGKGVLAAAPGAKLSKRKPHNRDTGYIAELTNRRTGIGHVIIYDAIKANLDATDGRYAVVCDAHKVIVNVTSMPKARSAMKSVDFCEKCAALAR